MTCVRFSRFSCTPLKEHWMSQFHRKQLREGSQKHSISDYRSRPEKSETGHPSFFAGIFLVIEPTEKCAALSIVSKCVCSAWNQKRSKYGNCTVKVPNISIFSASNSLKTKVTIYPDNQINSDLK